MVGKRIYIDEEIERGLKAVAARTGQPEAVHVRAALRAHFESQGISLQKLDPLLEVIRLVGDPEGPSDVARKHDLYLYGGAKRNG